MTTATEEIEKGFSAIKLAIGGNPAPFFRFPYLQDPEAARVYLGSRNIAMFSHDLDSFDFKMRKPEDVVKSIMTKLEKKGKGIILMHDFQQSTAKAMPELLSELKAKGYKVVHMKAKAPLATLPKWDEAAKGEIKGAVPGSDRPTASVVRTIEETGTTSRSRRRSEALPVAARAATGRLRGLPADVQVHVGRAHAHLALVRIDLDVRVGCLDAHLARILRDVDARARGIDMHVAAGRSPIVVALGRPRALVRPAPCPPAPSRFPAAPSAACRPGRQPRR